MANPSLWPKRTHSKVSGECDSAVSGRGAEFEEALNITYFPDRIRHARVFSGRAENPVSHANWAKPNACEGRDAPGGGGANLPARLVFYPRDRLSIPVWWGVTFMS